MPMLYITGFVLSFRILIDVQFRRADIQSLLLQNGRAVNYVKACRQLPPIEVWQKKNEENKKTEKKQKGNKTMYYFDSTNSMI